MSDSTPEQQKWRPFIPALLDDLRLKPSEFRVVCRVARRGSCFEGKDVLARACQMHPDTVKAAFKALVARGILSEQRRSGRTSVYTLNPPSEWKHEPPGKEGPGILSHGVEKDGQLPLGNDGRHPPENDGHKGSPLKENKEGSPMQPPASGRQEESSLNGPKTSKPRERDPIFDALATTTGIPLGGLTDTEAQRVAVAAREIRKASPGVTPEEVQRRAGNYRAHMPNAVLTAHGLKANWALCSKAPAASTPHFSNAELNVMARAQRDRFNALVDEFDSVFSHAERLKLVEEPRVSDDMLPAILERNPNYFRKLVRRWPNIKQRAETLKIITAAGEPVLNPQSR